MSESANREHKNSVFVKLFSDSDKILRLYNAISGNIYPQEANIKIITLESVLMNDIYNDLSFIIDDKLVVMVEHQSSINPNMPLRMLAYLVQIYDMLVDKRRKYSQKLIKIPHPEFIVLYNGEGEFPDEKILKLSDSFKDLPKGHKLNGSLELEVRVLNINKGRNSEIVCNSPELSGYTELISEIRNNISSGLNLNQAVAKAIKDCANKKILLEFLNKYGGDVMGFFSKEWDLEECLAVNREEAREEGLLKGAKILLDLGNTPDFVAKQFNLPLDRIIEL